MQIANPDKIWNTTLYLRLSRDDGDKEEFGEKGKSGLDHRGGGT